MAYPPHNPSQKKAMHGTALMYFYGNLTDLQHPKQKQRPIAYSFSDSPAVKDAIEALGIPHTEVNYIFVNEVPAGFNYQLQHNDKVSAYGTDAGFNGIPPLIPDLPAELTFIADVHLGKLARLLRLLGIDCLYDNQYAERNLVEIATSQPRILLTRSTGLLKHKTINWGYWLRSADPDEQVREVVKRYNLAKHIVPFRRCTVCNGLLRRVNKADIEAQLLPRTRAEFEEFWQCEHCRRIYWQGSHYERMMELVKELRA